MTVPREFLLPPALSPAELTRTLTEAWRGSSGLAGADAREVPVEGDLVFLDSFDALLRDAGLECRWEDGRLRLASLGDGEERAGLAMAIPRTPVRPAELPPGRLRELLRDVLELRALLPLATLPNRARGLHLLAGEAKTVVRVRVEQPHSLPARVRLLPLRGYGAELARAAELLSGGLGLSPAREPLTDAAVAASGHPIDGIGSKVHVALSRGMRADTAAVAVLTALLDVIEANRDGTLGDVDPEFLHDLRVSVRRSRTVQRQLRGTFPPAELERFRAEFKWLQQVTGDARDLDVYVHGFDELRALVPPAMAGDLDPLREVLRARRRAAHEEMALALRSGRAARLHEGWRELLGGLPGRSEADRPDARRGAEQVAGERIAKVYRRMVKMGRAIGPDTPAEEYHELRKKGKELRYLLELFGAELFPAEVVGPMVKTLKALQDTLGRHQDREVQATMLRELSGELSAVPGGGAALLATGALLVRLGEDERAARAEFAERFAAFASGRQRRLVRRTFR